MIPDSVNSVEFNSFGSRILYENENEHKILENVEVKVFEKYIICNVLYFFPF